MRGQFAVVIFLLLSTISSVKIASYKSSSKFKKSKKKSGHGMVKIFNQGDYFPKMPSHGSEDRENSNFQKIFDRNAEQGSSGACWTKSNGESTTENQRRETLKFSQYSEDSSSLFKCMYRRRKVKWIKMYRLRLGQSLGRSFVSKKLVSKSDSDLSNCDNYILDDGDRISLDDELSDAFHFRDYHDYEDGHCSFELSIKGLCTQNS